MTIQTLAAQLSAAFVSDVRTNGATFYKLADGSPEWMNDATFAAHGEFLPDDWRYAAIRELSSRMAESEDPEDGFEECDSAVDVYNSKLADWLASNNSRAAYVDEAIEEFGYPGDLIKALQCGQLAEYREIWAALYSFLSDMAEEEEEEGAAWVAGFNMPGYMPDSEPAEFDTWASARDYIREEIEREAAGYEGEREDDDSAIQALDALEEGEEFGQTVGAYHYWMTRA